MPSINLLFHVSSALTFALLIWYLLHLQSKLRLHTQFLDCLKSERKSVLVDWPDRFLGSLCNTFGIEHVWQINRLPAQRIERDPWVKAHAVLAFQNIHCVDQTLRIRIARPVDLDIWKAKLEASLQNKLRVEWDSRSDSSERKRGET